MQPKNGLKIGKPERKKVFKLARAVCRVKIGNPMVIEKQIIVDEWDYFRW